MFTIHNADSLDLLKTLPDHSVHAVVTDPPYGLGDMSPARVAECLQAWARGDTWTPTGKGFMGKQWDAWVPPPELWREVLRVLKPGGHAIVFAGSRTQDLMSVSLRLAGFEVRDTLQWLYGSGFPKSLDVSKALDKMAGAEREVIGTKSKPDGTPKTLAEGRSKATTSHAGWVRPWMQDPQAVLRSISVTAPATEPAQQWQGWGTALKPAYEPAILARKPLDGTVAQNTLAHGCGGLNLDACRVGEEVVTTHGPDFQGASHVGRWPANVILDEDAAALLDAQTGEPTSRFFYCAKASRAEREAGLDGHETKTGAELTGRAEGSAGLSAYAGTRGAQPRANTHPTVKPIALMRYLVKLVTPPNGTVLDPFTGSGSTGCAAALERVNFVGIELDPEYARIATARIEYWATQAQADTPQADTPQADTPQADTPQADTHPTDTPQVPPTAHKTTRGARRKAPAEDDPQGSLF